MLKRHSRQSSWIFTPLLSRTVKSTQHQNIRRYTNSMCNNTYITTPIFYVNSSPHIGHLYTAVLADSIARYKSMLGHSVVLSTGTDEHGNKVKTAAETYKYDIPIYCRNISNEFRSMCDLFDVAYTKFIRTTDEQHCKAVHHFWNVLEEKNHVYLGKYFGWYCESDEAFIPSSEIIHGENGDHSTISGNPVYWANEDNYMFRLSAFQDDLRYWLKQNDVVKPAYCLKMLSTWINDDNCMQDLSISRYTDKVPWGIPTPKDNSHTIYVWFDALVNYLTAVGYPDNSYKQFWPPSVQIIGKDILKFHGIYWPALLIAAGLEPPKTLLCHAHWTIDDYKMSKSKNNVVSPFQGAKDFTTNGFRYFLLREAVLDGNANYNPEKVIRIINDELANTLANLISRCSGTAINPWQEFPNPAEYVNILNSDAAKYNKNLLNSLQYDAQMHYESYALHHLVDTVMKVLKSANILIEYHKPWTLKKTFEEELKAVISLVLENVRIAALVLYPIIPQYSKQCLDFLNVPEENRTWEYTKPQYLPNASSKTVKLVNNDVKFHKIKTSA